MRKISYNNYDYFLILLEKKEFYLAFDYFINDIQFKEDNLKLYNLFLILFNRVIALSDIFIGYLNSLDLNDYLMPFNDLNESSNMLYNNLLELIFKKANIKAISYELNSIFLIKKGKSTEDIIIEKFIKYITIKEMNVEEYSESIKKVSGITEEPLKDSKIVPLSKVIIKKESIISSKSEDAFAPVIFPSIKNKSGIIIKKDSKELKGSKESKDYDRILDRISFLIANEKYQALKNILKGLTTNENKLSMNNLKKLVDLYHYLKSNNLPIDFSLLNYFKKVILDNYYLSNDEINNLKRTFVKTDNIVALEILEVNQDIELPIIKNEVLSNNEVVVEPLKGGEKDISKKEKETSEDSLKQTSVVVATIVNKVIIKKDIKEIPDYVLLLENNKDNYNNYLKCYNSKDYNNALNYLKLCLSSDIRINRYVYHLMSKCYYKMGNNLLYEEYTNKSNSLYQKNFKEYKTPIYSFREKILLNNFKLFYRLKNYTLAIYFYEKIKKTSSILDVKLAYMVAKCYKENDLPNKALKTYNEIYNVLVEENYPLKTITRCILSLENTETKKLENRNIKKLTLNHQN